MKHVGLSKKKSRSEIYNNKSHRIIYMITLFGTRISPGDSFLFKPNYLALKSYNNITQDLVLIDELHTGLGATFRIFPRIFCHLK